ncbi:MAG: hypothetical protein HUU46_25085 [Candidatus Hydrogenedentes bacterium]|nr:hypothetical protein [Candidatus Hydrogenedentota bacterium]
MRSPVRALIWEQWRQVWWTAPLSILLTTGVSFALHLDPEIEWYKDLWKMGSNGAIIASLALAGGLLLFAHSSPTDIRAGLPARHMTLPVRSLTLALSQYVFRFAYFVLLAYLLLTSISLIDDSYAENVLPGTVYASCVISILMASIWTIGRRSMFWASAIAIGIAVGMFFLHDSVSIRSSAAGYVLAFALIIAGSAIAVRGALRGHAVPRSGPGAIEAKAPRAATRSFRDPIQAYRWFEWRRKSRVVTYSAAAVLVPLLLLEGYDIWTNLQKPEQRMGSMVHKTGLGAQNPTLMIWTIPKTDRLARDLDGMAMTLVYAPPFIALISGVCFALLDHRDGTLRLANYVFTLPMSTRDMVRARFWFGTKATALLCIPCFLVSACLAALCVKLNTNEAYIVERWYPSSEYPLTLVLSFVATWALLWSPLPILLGLLWLGSVGLVLEFTGVRGEDPMRMALIAIPLAITVYATFRVVSRYRRGQCDAQAIEATMWIAILGGAILIGWSIADFGYFYDDELPLAAAMTMALLFYALVTQPHWLERLRHGRHNIRGQRTFMGG